MNLENPSLGCAFFNRLSYRFVEDAESGDATVELDVTDEIMGPNGSVHAGITTLLADVAGTLAIGKLTQRPGATSSVSIHCLSAAKVGPIRAVGTVVRAGRTTALADVRVTDVGNNDKLVAVAHVTGALFGERPAT